MPAPSQPGLLRELQWLSYSEETFDTQVTKRNLMALFQQRFRMPRAQLSGSIAKTLCRVALYLILSLPATANADAVKPPGKFLGAKNAMHPVWFKHSFLDFGEDIAEAAGAGKRLALYFYQDGCPYCNQLWTHNMAEADIEKLFKDNFDVVAINMWGDQEVVTVGGKSFTEKQLAEALNVNFTPTLLFYTENKQVALRINGYYPPERFRKALTYVKDQQEQVQSFSDYSRPSGSAEGVLLTEPFFKKPPHVLDQLLGEKPLAVLFEAPNCEDCEAFHQQTLAHVETRDLLQQMHVVQLNASDEQEVRTPSGKMTTTKAWYQSLGLSYLPAIVFFDANGTEVMRINAYFRNFHTQSIFAYVLEKAYLTEPNFQRYISARAERIREQGRDVDLWEP